MIISDDKILQQDMEKISEKGFIPWQQLNGCSIMVTGATGLIGSQIVMALLMADERWNLGLTIYAAVRNADKADKIFAYADKTKLKYVIQDIMQPFDISERIDYIIHGASMTGSKDFVDYPVETIKTALGGTENVLELAKRNPIKGMVYLSSLEIYGVVDFDIPKVPENMNGNLDSMSVRSSYSEGKRMAECMCAAYASEYNLPIKVARLCQTFGPGVSYDDNRVFAQFARSIIEGCDIVLRTDGGTERNYCYTADAIVGILMVLLEGEKGEAYNVANEDTLISIREMAEMLIAKYPESGTKLVFDIAQDVTKLGYNPKVRMNLDTAKLVSLGWEAETPLEIMFENLIKSMIHRK